MKIQQFLEHYGVKVNPFSQEDAQSDHIFQQHCAETIHHPAWDKVLGDCRNPSTSIVFGEKGAGKTAIRLQLINALKEHNLQFPGERAFVISYDDLNPFLDAFRDRLRGRRRNPDQALKDWRLWDHMDALLTLSTRRLCNVIADGHAVDPDFNLAQIRELPRQRKRDLLMLAAFYDQSSDQSHLRRWTTIRRQIGFGNPTAHWRFGLGILITLLVLVFSLRNITTDTANPPAVEGVCDSCGSSEFKRRPDDNEETVRTRMQEYRAKTAPILPGYEARGIVTRVDGMAEIDAVAEAIDAILG